LDSDSEAQSKVSLDHVSGPVAACVDPVRRWNRVQQYMAYIFLAALFVGLSRWRLVKLKKFQLPSV